MGGGGVQGGGCGRWLDENSLETKKTMSPRCSGMGMNTLTEFLDLRWKSALLKALRTLNSCGLDVCGHVNTQGCCRPGCVHGHADQASGGKCVQAIRVGHTFPPDIFSNRV